MLEETSYAFALGCMGSTAEHLDEAGALFAEMVSCLFDPVTIPVDGIGIRNRAEVGTCIGKSECTGHHAEGIRIHNKIKRSTLVINVNDITEAFQIVGIEALVIIQRSVRGFIGIDQRVMLEVFFCNLLFGCKRVPLAKDNLRDRRKKIVVFDIIAVHVGSEGLFTRLRKQNNANIRLTLHNIFDDLETEFLDEAEGGRRRAGE